MPAPTATTRRVRRLLAGVNLTIENLPALLGRDKRSIQGVLNGSKPTRPIQQAITDLVGIEVWPGVKPLPARAAIILPAGTVIRFPAGNEIVERFAEFLGQARVLSPGEITLETRCRFTFERPRLERTPAIPSSTKKTRKTTH